MNSTDIIQLPNQLMRHYVPGHQVTKTHVAGNEEMERNHLPEALTIFEKEPATSPCHSLAFGNSGLILLRLEQFEKAETRLKEVLNEIQKKGCPHPPSQVQFARNLAESVASQGRLGEAFGIYEEAAANAEQLAAKHTDFAEDIQLERAHIFNSWGAGSWNSNDQI